MSCDWARRCSASNVCALRRCLVRFVRMPSMSSRIGRGNGRCSAFSVYPSSNFHFKSRKGSTIWCAQSVEVTVVLMVVYHISQSGWFFLHSFLPVFYSFQLKIGCRRAVEMVRFVISSVRDGFIRYIHISSHSHAIGFLTKNESRRNVFRRRSNCRPIPFI